jgi:hypothetical protein
MMTTRWLTATLGALLLAGCGEISSPDDDDAGVFVPVPDPTIEDISPDRGPMAGGTTVTVTGTGFNANGATATMILLGGRIAPNVDVTSDTALTFETPAGLAPGAVDVTIFNESGFVAATGGFAYNAAPAFAAVSPDLANGLGGGTLTITGSGFAESDAGVTTIEIGGIEAADVAIVSDTELTATMPAMAAPFGLADITISNANGEAAGLDALRYGRPGLIGGTVWRSDLDKGKLYWINPATGGATELFRVSDDGVGNLVTAADGSLLAVVYDNDRVLVRIDLFTQTVTTIGPFTIDGGNYSIADLELLGDRLFTTRCCSALSAGGVDGNSITLNGALGGYPMALAPNGSDLWLIGNRMSSVLRSVSSTTGLTTDGPTMNGSATEKPRAAAMHAGQIYVTTYDDAGGYRLHTLNPTTGAVTFVGEVPGIDGLTGYDL